MDLDSIGLPPRRLTAVLRVPVSLLTAGRQYRPLHMPVRLDLSWTAGGSSNGFGSVSALGLQVVRALPSKGGYVTTNAIVATHDTLIACA